MGRIVCHVRRNMVWWGMGWDGIVSHVRRNMVGDEMGWDSVLC